MAKTFYSAKEAAEKLGKPEGELKDLVRAGKLREFRDAGTINYKVSDVDNIAKAGGAAPAKPAAAKAPAAGKSGVAKSAGGTKHGSAIKSASQSGEILLEPADDSGIELAPSSSDIMSLEGVDAEDTAVGARAKKEKMEGSSAVPSVGMNVFDDDELDEHVDPLAQTAVSDVAGLGLEGVGSGSGILDLTRESDDTSLGAELLEEIYTGEEQPESTGGTVEMGEDTRAGLDAAVQPGEVEETEPTAEELEPAAAATTVTAGLRQRTVVTKVVEYGPDAVSRSLTAAMVVATVVIWISGVAAAAALQDVAPSFVTMIYSNLLIFAGGALVAAGLAAGLTYFLARRSES